ncbi:GNAT family protein [Gottschalkiaceae bacterium SANA]|nr:GNAT family protein [Gottschalkiaceae bacterium SANA]
MTIQIETERMILKTGVVEDLSEIVSYFQRNKSFLAPFEPIQPDIFYTKAKQREVMKNDFLEWKEEKSLRLWLFEKSKPQRVIGSIRFANVVRGAFQSCFLGYRLDQDCERKGLMTEALREAIPLAFDRLHLHRIEANVMPRNLASRRVVEKLGFRQEGLAKRYLNIYGKWEDHIHYAIVREEWKGEWKDGE